MNEFFCVIFIFFVVSCSERRKAVESIPEKECDEIEYLTEDSYSNLSPVKIQISFYDDVHIYKNNLSTFASNIRFVKLNNESLVRIFVHNIQQCDSFLFLQGPEYIYKYDRNLSFIFV